MVNKHRKVDELKHIDPQSLPSYIKHGVPAAMSASIDKCFWGNPIGNSNEQTCADTLKAIGMPFSKGAKVIASCKNQEVLDTLKECKIDHNASNARQVFQQIKTNKQKPHLAMPYRCTRPPC